MTAVVQETPGFEVVGRATSGEEAIEDQAERLRPDLVLLDVNLPGIDGLETTRRLRTLQPAVVVLLLSTYDDEAGESFVAQSGAAGYVTKAAFGPDRLAAAWTGEPNVDDRPALGARDDQRPLGGLDAVADVVVVDRPGVGAGHDQERAAGIRL